MLDTVRLLDVSDDDKMGTVNLQGVVGDDCTVDECECEAEW